MLNVVGVTFLAAAALKLFLPAGACICLPERPLLECAVVEDEAALLVTIKRVTIDAAGGACDSGAVCASRGNAVAEVEIDHVFKDMTGLNLKKGDIIPIGSVLEYAECGRGEFFASGDTWIMSANTLITPDSARAPTGDLTTVNTTRRLLDTKLSVPEVDLWTSVCSFSMFAPTEADVADLKQGCGGAALTPRPVFTSRPPALLRMHHCKAYQRT